MSYNRPQTTMCNKNPKSPKLNPITFPESYLAKVNEYLEGVERRKKAWKTIIQRASEHTTSSLEIDNLTTRLETPDGIEQGGHTNLERYIPIIQERDPEYTYLMMKEQRKRLLIHNKIRDNSWLGISMNKGKLEGIGQEERVPVNFDHIKDNKESTEEMGANQDNTSPIKDIPIKRRKNPTVILEMMKARRMKLLKQATLVTEEEMKTNEKQESTMKEEYIETRNDINNDRKSIIQMGINPENTNSTEEIPIERRKNPIEIQEKVKAKRKRHQKQATMEPKEGTKANEEQNKRVEIETNGYVIRTNIENLENEEENTKKEEKDIETNIIESEESVPSAREENKEKDERPEEIGREENRSPEYDREDRANERDRENYYTHPMRDTILDMLMQTKEAKDILELFQRRERNIRPEATPDIVTRILQLDTPPYPSKCACQHWNCGEHFKTAQARNNHMKKIHRREDKRSNTRST